MDSLCGEKCSRQTRQRHQAVFGAIRGRRNVRKLGEAGWYWNYLFGLVVKAPASKTTDLGSIPAFARDLFQDGVIPVTSKIGTPVAILPGAWRCKVSTGTGWPSVIYCDWVRWKVWSANSVSVWQHAQLSSRIRRRDTLVCCWNVKQPTNINVHWTPFVRYHDREETILFYSILGCVLPLQEVALRQSPPSFSVLCCPCPYRSLLPHNVVPPTTFWSSNWSYAL